MYNILVCDDDKEIVKAIEIYLSKEGYNVLKTYNGEDALKILNNNKIHLIILDIMMPVKDGIETLKEIRKSESIPVIMLSAKSEDEENKVYSDVDISGIYIDNQLEIYEILFSEYAVIPKDIVEQSVNLSEIVDLVNSQ